MHRLRLCLLRDNRGRNFIQFGQRLLLVITAFSTLNLNVYSYCFQRGDLQRSRLRHALPIASRHQLLFAATSDAAS